jgi:heptosyltransferase III
MSVTIVLIPDAHLEVLGYPHIVQLAVAGGLADSVRSIEAGPLAGFFARNGTLDETLQKYFSEFALIISYLFDPDKIFQTNVARCAKAQFIAGPHRPKEQDGNSCQWST